jgi:hypothetical protein
LIQQYLSVGWIMVLQLAELVIQVVAVAAFDAGLPVADPITLFRGIWLSV